MPTREEEQALTMFKIAHGDDKTLADLRADPADVSKWAQWDGNAKKMPGAIKSSKAVASTPETAAKGLSSEEERALAQYRAVHDQTSTLADVRADGGVAAWAHWDGNVKKMPRAKAEPPAAGANLMSKLDAAALQAELTDEEERALAQYQAAHGDGSTLAEVRANGGVAAWAQWDGSAKKMPRAKRDQAEEVPPAAAAKQAATSAGDLVDAESSIAELRAYVKEHGLDVKTAGPGRDKATILQDILQAVGQGAAAAKGLSSEEERALAQYRAVHDQTSTLADVQADGGVAAWAQWDGNVKKMPRAKAAPAKTPTKSQPEANPTNSLPQTNMSTAKDVGTGEPVATTEARQLTAEEFTVLMVGIGVVGLAFWVYKGLEYVGMV